ncbi:hypothetical protein HPB47_020402, partial [Ixodes persulcatus]
MLTADHTVCILFYTPREPLLVPGKDGAYTAEHLCMQAAELCGIGPVTAQLFGLFSAETGIWFAPSANVKAKDKSLNVYFRLRYKPPTLDRIKAEEATLNYVYHQMRQDFVCGRVPELHHNRVQHRTLGLVVTDVVRHLIEVGQNPQQGSFSFSDFMPAVLVGPLKMRVLKPRLTNALNECWHNSRQNVNRVKEIYVNEFRSIVPEYGCEQFVAQVDSDGRVWEVVLQVNPHHPQMPGLRMHSKASKENIRFSSVSRMQSFLSLLDGYYRLMEKWTVNLCINLPTPSLTALRAMRCHGPIGARFAYQKLQEKSNHESGWYLLRQSSSAYREFRLDFLGQDETPETLRIVQSAEDGTFRLDQGEGQAFPSLTKLVNDGVKPMLSLELAYCVPPSEYDKTQLLLCRAPGSVSENVAPAREPRECIHSRSLAFSESRKDELHGRFTVVRRAFLCKAKNLHREVAVKSLKPHLEDSHLKASAEFMAQCDRMLFWQCEAMVSSVGMVHSGSFGLVTEFCLWVLSTSTCGSTGCNSRPWTSWRLPRGSLVPSGTWYVAPGTPRYTCRGLRRNRVACTEKSAATTSSSRSTRPTPSTSSFPTPDCSFTERGMYNSRRSHSYASCVPASPPRRRPQRPPTARARPLLSIPDGGRCRLEPEVRNVGAASAGRLRARGAATPSLCGGASSGPRTRSGCTLLKRTSGRALTWKVSSASRR